MNKIIILTLLIILSGSNLKSKECEIIQITPSTRHLVPKGKSFDAIDGDWIMKNDKVIAIIGKADYGREANFRSQSVQGAVIDFTSLADNNDHLDALYPQGYPAHDSRRNPAVFADKIEILSDKGPEVSLRAIRNPTVEIPYESVTEYTLIQGENFLRIKTIYYNQGKEDVLITFADKLRMGYMTKDASHIGEYNLAFLFDKWFDVAYGIYRKEGLLITEEPIIGSDPAVGFLVGFKDDKVEKNATITLSPGERIEALRYLLYGKDVAEIQRYVMDFDKENEAIISTIKIEDTKKEPIKGVFLDVFNESDERVSFAKTDTNGIVKIPLIVGEYRFQATKIGHDTLNYDFIVTNKPDIILATIQPLTSIKFTIQEAGTTRFPPVKLEFKGINGCPDPYLGPVSRAEGANNLFYAINKGSFNVPIQPGQYLVIISRGPEYEVIKKEININRGETKFVTAEIRRLFFSLEWVPADLHVHSVVSGDALAEARSQIINLAATGIEFAPATEHNRIHSFSDIIDEIGLEKYIASCAGLEMTGPPGVVRGGPNHQNAWPLTFSRGKQSGGAPSISEDIYIQTKRLYDYDKGRVKFLVHNHPGIDLPNLYFDKNRDGILDNGWGIRGLADAIELQDYTFEILNVTSDRVKNKKSPVFYWLQMLNQGDRIFNITTSDSHTVGEKRGLRFVYVYAKKDEPISIDPYEIASNAKKGHIIMSYGPFLKTDINGYLPGDEIISTPNGLILSIEVYANNEIEIDRVQVLVNGRQDKNLNFTLESHPEFFHDDAMQFKYSFPLILKNDANIIVVAAGTKLTKDTRLTNDADDLPEPMAISNPFFIDVNGDGYIPNKDTLGEPLPVSVRAN